MEKRRKKIVVFGLATIFSFLSLTACSGKKEEAKTSTESSSTIVEKTIETKSNAATIIVEDSSK